MQPFGLEHMSFDQLDERLQRKGDVADLVGHVWVDRMV